MSSVNKDLASLVLLLVLALTVGATGCLGDSAKHPGDTEGDSVAEDGVPRGTPDGSVGPSTNPPPPDVVPRDRTESERGHGGEGETGRVDDERTRDPKKSTVPPDYAFWIQPHIQDVRISREDEDTRIYPEFPRTANEIQEDFAQRAARQRTLEESRGITPDFAFRSVREETGIEFEHDALEIVRKTPNSANYLHYGGVATADVDSDGNQDLYFLNQVGPNELWINRGNGTFTNATGRAGVGVGDEVASSAAFADYDGDGDVDLHVTTLTGRNYLFRNDGDGSFTDVTRSSGLSMEHRHSSSSVFFDYDGDGDLDLYVVNLANFTSLAEGEDGYRVPTARVVGFPKGWAESSVLYRNQGDGTFTQVETVIERGGSWDNDAALVPQPGSPPGLYVADIDGEDGFYRNEGSSFREVTEQELGPTPHGSFGVKVLDADGDGRFDIYVTDKHSDMMMYSDHGGLSLHEIGQRPDSPETGESLFDDDVLLGSALYMRGKEGYTERAQEMNAQTFLPWGADAGDLNADGLSDLYVTGGMEYARYVPDALLLNGGEDGMLRAEFLTDVYPREGSRYTTWDTVDCEDPPNLLWCQPREGHRLEGEVKVMNTRSSRGAVVVDIDGDGDLDIVTNEMNARPRVLESTLMQDTSRSYLKVELQGRTAPRDGTGAVVTLTTTEGESVAFESGKAYLAQNDRPLYFGLEEGEEPRYLEVEWPTGDVDRYEVDGSEVRVTVRQHTRGP